MLHLRTQGQFEKDLKRQIKRGAKQEKLWNIVEKLLAEEALAAKYRPHKLSGNWAHCWECHIEPDWLLIYQVVDDRLELVRTGTHSDLF